MAVISIALFYILTQRFDLVKPPRRITAILVATPWVLPTITSLTALMLHYYHPVSGNWCWIQAKPKYLRYVFTHGWRFVFIIIILVMGVRIRLYVKRTRPQSQPAVTDEFELEETHEYSGSMWKEPAQSSTEIAHSELLLSTPRKQREEALLLSEKKKTLRLLSGYPLFYVVLWLPGIANRIAEATGHPVRALAIMQASTAYIGFANAATFGWNEVRNQFSVHRLLEMTLGFMLA